MSSLLVQRKLEEIRNSVKCLSNQLNQKLRCYFTDDTYKTCLHVTKYTDTSAT